MRFLSSMPRFVGKVNNETSHTCLGTIDARHRYCIFILLMFFQDIGVKVFFSGVWWVEVARLISLLRTP